MKKSILALVVLSIFGTTTISAKTNHKPQPQHHHRIEARHHHNHHPRVERIVEVRPAAPRTVVVTRTQPVPAPRPVVVVERRNDNVAAAVVGGIIGGVIGGVIAR